MKQFASSGVEIRPIDNSDTRGVGMETQPRKHPYFIYPFMAAFLTIFIGIILMMTGWSPDPTGDAFGIALAGILVCLLAGQTPSRRCSAPKPAEPKKEEAKPAEPPNKEKKD